MDSTLITIRKDTYLIRVTLFRYLANVQANSFYSVHNVRKNRAHRWVHCAMLLSEMEQALNAPCHVIAFHSIVKYIVPLKIEYPLYIRRRRTTCLFPLEVQRS